MVAIGPIALSIDIIAMTIAIAIMNPRAVQNVAGAGGIVLRQLDFALILDAILPSVAIRVGGALHAAAFGHLFWDIIAWDIAWDTAWDIAWDTAPSRVPIYPWHLSDQVPQVAHPVLAILAVRIGQTTLPLAFALPCKFRKKYVCTLGEHACQ